METHPILSDWKAKILSYQSLEEDIEEIQPWVQVGAIELKTGNLSILVEMTVA